MMQVREIIRLSPQFSKLDKVELKAKSLNSGDVFILDDGLTIYQWQGKTAGTQVTGLSVLL